MSSFPQNNSPTQVDINHFLVQIDLVCHTKEINSSTSVLVMCKQLLSSSAHNREQVIQPLNRYMPLTLFRTIQPKTPVTPAISKSSTICFHIEFAH